MPKISAKAFQTAAATTQGGSSVQIRNMREKAMSMSKYLIFFEYFVCFVNGM
jgi:hypothetical protein